MAVPTYDELFDPTLKAIHKLGGSASLDEMEETIVEDLKLSEEDISEIHRGSTTKLRYRLAWARNYLKRFGLLENSTRGVWALTPQGKITTEIDKEIVKRTVQGRGKKTSIEEEVEEGEEPGLVKTWKEDLMDRLQSLEPAAFEKLCQRILREAGFVRVEVTGKTGDGGIDGTGIIRLNGLLSYNIVFQCKRYTGSVSSSQIRDFRGALQGRADKGLFITTGTFTRDARAEASRSGAMYIDLIDGQELVEKMRELRLGVIIEMQESVEIDEEWFNGF